jgi:hypothetical protein
MNITIFWIITLSNHFMNLSSSETSAHIRTTQRYIPGDGNMYNYLRENLTSYTNTSRLLYIG